ncbi:MAG: hypothetical protein GC182_16390 [Rhodopseudomonas sp.]|nr:hypothetical protein [Rhodopseudomonas sp.]
MLGRLLIVVAMMLFGPLFIEVYLYHPMIALEHDMAALVPLVASPLAILTGFLMLAVDRRMTAGLFGLVCLGEVAVGVVGAAIHIAIHAPSFASLVTEPNVWLGNPPPLVPLSFAAAGCLGLIPVVLPGQRLMLEPPVAIARILYALAALCGLVAVVTGAQAEAGVIALCAVIAALGFGSFGYVAEAGMLAYGLWRDRAA